ncbi:MAG: hypothetical protein HQ591_06170 [candidate division Zixibacteria bacterium]|nr:hypothetical protein [Candidatus Tariuqbacter arcticus]
MYTTYRIKANEIDKRFLDSVKAQFKDREIEIVVSEYEDETEYLLKSKENKKRLDESLKDLKAGRNLHEVNLDELE